MSVQTQFEIDGTWTSVADGEIFLDGIATDTQAQKSIIGYSVQNNPISALTVGSGNRTCVVTGGVHGTEPASREAILIKMRDVCYNADGAYTDYLNDHKIIFIPTVNPDRMHSSYRNAENIDINRVIYHLDSPEGVAFLNLIRDVEPDAFFDFHEHSGSTDKDVLYVRAMTLDPNSDKAVRDIQTQAIDAVRQGVESKGFSTDYYFDWNTGFGSLTSGLGILGILAFTSETSTKADNQRRVDAQKESFDLSLSWHMNNHQIIDDTKSSFNSNMVKENGKYVLLQSMNTGAEMYTQASYEFIDLPYGYKPNDISDFQNFIDVYDVEVDTEGVVPVNQKAGRLIPHLLDPRADQMKVESTLVYSQSGEQRTDGRYSKAKFSRWEDVFFKSFAKK
ncbi:M14 family zinc carboxypeptidase [Salinicoccus roseus]|uniref:M14 family zinc carboxypeptidase n=1 Tax=Salinicoccus roseus TaxID=45670 RepID=A0A0C2H8B4_9STAP|nr:M14 family zinc carboxypeptidase [Salinicoccus roseus]KIH70075.1 hypothetical protein SN16_11300 [Salinicoccus roseus]MDB0581390.1 M14 family zinc carboxypeptidase [Salinicoccus roseus]